jgi:ABC-type ATPase involved in cell division
LPTGAAGHTKEVMLRIEGVLARSAGDQAVLDGADLEVAPGQIRVVYGESGTGKSTLIRLLAGLEHPRRGRVIALDRDLSRLRRSSLRRLRRRIAVLDEVPLVLDDRSVYANVALPLELDGLPARAIRQRAAAAIAEVGLQEQIDARAGGLASSQRRLVAFARAVAREPAVVLADEPGRDLDETGRERICAVLDRLAAAGASCLVTTGDRDMVELADLWGWPVSELRLGALSPFHEAVPGLEMGHLLAFPAAARAGSPG